MLRLSVWNFLRMTVLIGVVLIAGRIGSAAASEPLVIAASPSLAVLIERHWEGLPRIARPATRSSWASSKA